MTVSVGAATVVLAGTVATISEVSSNGPASIQPERPTVNVGEGMPMNPAAAQT